MIRIAAFLLAVLFGVCAAAGSSSAAAEENGFAAESVCSDPDRDEIPARKPKIIEAVNDRIRTENGTAG